MLVVLSLLNALLYYAPYIFIEVQLKLLDLVEKTIYAFRTYSFEEFAANLLDFFCYLRELVVFFV